MANLINTFSKLNKAEWNATGKTLDEGVNCFSLLVNFLNETGHNIPFDNLPEGYTYENIKALWEEDDKKAVKVMTEYLLQWGYEKDKKDMRIGDILVLENNKGKYFPAIYGGNGKMVTMIAEHGCYHSKLANYKIHGVYRGYKV